MKTESHSGRFLLRLPPALHRQLARSAARLGLSLNEHCVRLLSRGEAARTGALDDVVAHAVRHHGTELVGVVAFGSWARGEAGEESDVDVLLVLGPGARLTRSLYRPWDEAEFQVDGRAVEAHLAVLPSVEDPVTGLWAEAAMDGVVVWDPELEVARCLGRIRRAVLSGALVRRAAGGQHWWSAG